jgi:hypothetical protein
MKKYTGLFIILAGLLSLSATAQERSGISQWTDLTGTIGDREGAVAGAWVNNWRLGRQKKWEIGLGGRGTAYFGSRKEFYTAPGRLARSNTSPFLIVFAGHEERNIDTLFVRCPFTFSLSLDVNFGYNFSPRWYAGFNIDLAGFTWGSSSDARLLSNGAVLEESSARPARFNVLLTGDNDYGSLNSEFFIRWRYNKKLSFKALYQFFFAEYKTQHVRQIAPDGTEVDRFRNKVNAVGLGIVYHLQD